MTTLPPPGEPDIYQSLLDAMVQASQTMRTANAAYAAALQPLRQAMESIGRTGELMEQAGELSDRAHEISQAAHNHTDQADQAGLLESGRMFRRAAELHGEARVLARQSYFAILQASPLIMEGVAAMLEASEEHRIGLERATTLLQQARRHQTNGGRPDAQAA